MSAGAHRPLLKARIRKSQRGSWWIVQILGTRDELVATAPFDTWSDAMRWVTGQKVADQPLPRLKALSLRAVLGGGQP